MSKHKGVLVVLAVTILTFLVVFTAFMNREMVQNSEDILSVGVDTEVREEEVTDTEVLEDTERGSGGFGHSGTN